MIIYLGGNDYEYQASGYNKKSEPPARLFSYFYLKGSDKKLKELKNTKGKIFLDSGAFSAWNSKKEIDLKEYIKFVKKHKNHMNSYAGLDVIGDPKATLVNQRKMEKAKLKPLPCFHYKEDVNYLKMYLKDHDHIALGGMVHASKRKGQLYAWLDKIFSEYLCDDKGYPKVKVHGFGIASLDAMLRYPWHSIDTTTWGYASRMGEIMVPKMREGDWDYTEIPSRVAMTETTTKKKNNFANLPPLRKKQVTQYCIDKGWSVKKVGKDIVARGAINIQFFQDFGASVEYPKPMVLDTEERGFGLE